MSSPKSKASSPDPDTSLSEADSSDTHDSLDPPADESDDGANDGFDDVDSDNEKKPSHESKWSFLEIAELSGLTLLEKDALIAGLSGDRNLMQTIASRTEHGTQLEAAMCEQMFYYARKDPTLGKYKDLSSLERYLGYIIEDPTNARSTCTKHGKFDTVTTDEPDTGPENLHNPEEIPDELEEWEGLMFLGLDLSPQVRQWLCRQEHSEKREFEVVIGKALRKSDEDRRECKEKIMKTLEEYRMLGEDEGAQVPKLPEESGPAIADTKVSSIFGPQLPEVSAEEEPSTKAPIGSTSFPPRVSGNMKQTSQQESEPSRNDSKPPEKTGQQSQPSSSVPQTSGNSAPPAASTSQNTSFLNLPDKGGSDSEDDDKPKGFPARSGRTQKPKKTQEERDAEEEENANMEEVIALSKQEVAKPSKRGKAKKKQEPARQLQWWEVMKGWKETDFPEPKFKYGYDYTAISDAKSREKLLKNYDKALAKEVIDWEGQYKGLSSNNKIKQVKGNGAEELRGKAEHFNALSKQTVEGSKQKKKKGAKKDEKTQEEAPCKNGYYWKLHLRYGIPLGIVPITDIQRHLKKCFTNAHVTVTIPYTNSKNKLNAIRDGGRRHRWDNEADITATLPEISELEVCRIIGDADLGPGYLPKPLEQLLKQTGLLCLLVPSTKRIIPMCWKKKFEKEGLRYKSVVPIGDSSQLPADAYNKSWVKTKPKTEPTQRQKKVKPNPLDVIDLDDFDEHGNYDKDYSESKTTTLPGKSSLFGTGLSDSGIGAIEKVLKTPMMKETADAFRRNMAAAPENSTVKLDVNPVLLDRIKKLEEEKENYRIQNLNPVLLDLIKKLEKEKENYRIQNRAMQKKILDMEAEDNKRKRKPGNSENASSGKWKRQKREEPQESPEKEEPPPFDEI